MIVDQDCSQVNIVSSIYFFVDYRGVNEGRTEPQALTFGLLLTVTSLPDSI